MYSAEYRFYPKDTSVESCCDRLWQFLGSLRQNGQICGDDAAVIRQANAYVLNLLAPCEDSLDPKIHDQYAARDYSQLLEMSAIQPEWTVTGEAMLDSQACACEHPSSYILMTTFIRVEPPVACGDCGGYIPLYRLPRLGEHESYWPIITWESTYKACDRLYMNSGVGERFGLKQMRDPKSKLTEDGLAICREWQGKLGKPFYYYLWTDSERRIANCPGCGVSWKRDEPLADRFDLVCESCGFVSIGDW